jgi:hypothetical protein
MVLSGKSWFHLSGHANTALSDYKSMQCSENVFGDTVTQRKM